jgi:hypothetical protein
MMKRTKTKTRTLAQMWEDREMATAFDEAMAEKRRRDLIAKAIMETAGEEVMTWDLAKRCSDAIALTLPPTSEKTCESPMCPRKNHLSAAGHVGSPGRQT